MATEVIKTADEQSSDTVFQNDDELQFTVDASSTYLVRTTLFIQSDADQPYAYFAWDVPVGGVAAWARVEDENLEENSEAEVYVQTTGVMVREYVALITTGDAGDVVLKWRNHGDRTSGGTTVKAGSLLEVFEAS